jgi:Pin2-interacting protein X1
VLRDDNAGLGVQKGKSNADTFGLATLSGIFGRLNGKSEVEVQKQADTVRDLELQTYQMQKRGMMNFVYGGLLVGDKMEEGERKRLAEHNAKVLQSKRKAEDDTPAEISSSKKRKHSKGKSSEAASESSNESDAETEASKKKQKKRSKKGEPAADSSSETAERASKKERKEKHKKGDKSGERIDKAQAKEEKRARKEARRKRREEKRARKEAKGKASAQTSRDQSSDSSSDEADTPAPKPTTPSFASGRLAVRQRYIMQKRQAGMNPQAMAEILMLKAGA